MESVSDASNPAEGRAGGSFTPIAATVAALAGTVALLAGEVSVTAVLLLLAGLAIGTGTSPRRQPRAGTAGDGRDSLKVALSRARREESGADLLFVGGESPVDGPGLTSLARTLRVTDASAIERRNGRWEMLVLVPHRDARPTATNGSAPALEGAGSAAIVERIGRLAGARPSAGVARFPEEGLTLDVLIDRARGRALESAAPALRRGARTHSWRGAAALIRLPMPNDDRRTIR